MNYQLNVVSVRKAAGGIGLYLMKLRHISTSFPMIEELCHDAEMISNIQS